MASHSTCPNPSALGQRLTWPRTPTTSSTKPKLVLLSCPSPTDHEACVTELCAAAAKDDWLLLVSDYNAWSENALARAAGLDGSVDDILDDCPLVPRP